MVRVENLLCHHSSFCDIIKTLKNISTIINKGEHLSIVGRNGAGKTTFIKLLCKLYDNYEGDILVNDKDIRDMKFEEYVELLSVVQAQVF